MKRFFNFLIIVAGCVAAFYGVGLIVPRNQVQTTKTTSQKKPTEIYALVADLSTWPSWHPDVARTEERPRKGDHPVWRITTKEGEVRDLEVTTAEDQRHWQGMYDHDGTHTTMRLDLSWYGEGAQMVFSRSSDTHDPWLRAKWFFLPERESSALELQNAILTELGDAPKPAK